MTFEVTILGSNSAIPTTSRHPSAQILNFNERYYLIDCGEGTQIELRKRGFKFQRIEHIFISHLHGDHYFGLIGLLNTMHLLGRNKPITIHCPAPLRDILQIQFDVAGAGLRFKINYNFLPDNGNGVFFEDEYLRVFHAPLNHRIACHAFVFHEQPHAPKIRKEAIAAFDLTIGEIAEIKAGAEHIRSGSQKVSVADLCVPPGHLRTYAYVTDTKPDNTYYSAIAGVDLLYHESTFAEDQKERAAETHHSTAGQAGLVAQQCRVKKLIIGHFSTRYKNLEMLLSEAREIFPETQLALEGETFAIPMQRNGL
jgi:ribonuclease Z